VQIESREVGPRLLIRRFTLLESRRADLSDVKDRKGKAGFTCYLKPPIGILVELLGRLRHSFAQMPNCINTRLFKVSVLSSHRIGMVFAIMDVEKEARGGHGGTNALTYGKFIAQEKQSLSRVERSDRG
jgi:hypothetical protein